MRKAKLAKVTAIVSVLTQNTHLSGLVTFFRQMELVAKCYEISCQEALNQNVAGRNSKDPKCHSKRDEMDNLSILKMYYMDCPTDLQTGWLISKQYKLT